jgi:hypothetical protein
VTFPDAPILFARMFSKDVFPAPDAPKIAVTFPG